MSKSTRPINLEERFGKKYRITLEESAQHERDATEQLWLLMLPCRYGHIYPQGGDLLGFASTTRGPIVNRLAEIPGVRLMADGDDGANLVFPFALFRDVARIVKPRVKRQQSETQRQASIERLANYRFSAARQCSSSERQSVRAG